MIEPHKNKLLFSLILSVCAIVPLTNDIFISGITQMTQYFPGSNISLVLSVSLLGLAISQTFYGPLSDRFGRKPVLLIGLIIYTVMSAIVTFSTSFYLLLLGRFIQAVGACSAIVSALAIARDCYSKENLVSATSMIMAILGAGPAFAPLIGSFLNNYWGWRASFGFLFVLGLAYTLLIYFSFDETHKHKNMQALSIKSIIRNYYVLGKNLKFLTYCSTSGLSYGVLFSYIALSSLFIIEKLGYSLIQFGIMVAFNALAIIVMSTFSPKITRKISLDGAMCLGAAVICCGGLIMWALNTIWGLSIYTFMIPIFITTVGIGMIRPTASAGAMSQVERNVAGSAAAFFNFFSFVAGSFATVIASRTVEHAASFGLFIALMGLCALLFNKVNRFKML